MDTNQYKIITMNTGGPTGLGFASRRKEIIDKVMLYENPDIILVQEFKWIKLWDSGNWGGYNVFGNEEAKVIYNVNKFEVTPLDGNKLRSIIDYQFPTDFTPLPRMCICKVKSKGVPHAEFLCVSWHGWYRRYTEANRTGKFQTLLNFLKIISDKEGLPLLIGGDFNLNINIAQQVPSVFKVLDYNPLPRHEGKVIDYFITRNLEIKNVYPIDITKYQVVKPYQVLDHDPISCIFDASCTLIGSAIAWQPPPLMEPTLLPPIPSIAERIVLPTPTQYVIKDY